MFNNKCGVVGLSRVTSSTTTGEEASRIIIKHEEQFLKVHLSTVTQIMGRGVKSVYNHGGLRSASHRGRYRAPLRPERTMRAAAAPSVADARPMGGAGQTLDTHV